MAAAVFLIFQMRSVLGDPQQLEKVRPQLKDVQEIAPESPTEKRTFAAMAISPR